MQNLLVNMKPAEQGGPLLLPEGAKAQFLVGDAPIELTFAPCRENFIWDNGKLTMTDMEAPQGMAITIPLNANGQPGKLMFWVTTMGRKPDLLMRQVAYTYCFD